jgi:hypothetical protein
MGELDHDNAVCGLLIAVCEKSIAILPTNFSSAFVTTSASSALLPAFHGRDTADLYYVSRLRRKIWSEKEKNSTTINGNTSSFLDILLLAE